MLAATRALARARLAARRALATGGPGGAKKSKQMYICSECGAQASRWQGQCSGCRAWNTMELGAVRAKGQRTTWTGDRAAQLTPLADVSTQGAGARIRLGSHELDHVLGGGVVPGALMLVAGSPGVGKSTLMMQLAGMLRDAGASDKGGSGDVVYVSGEESGEQLRLRADRLGLDPRGISLLCETHVETVLEATEGAAALIVDSVQTMHSDRHGSPPGTVSQVRESAVALLQAAKQRRVPVFLTGHVTKAGDAAGPRVLEHVVDVVAYVEGDPFSEHRLVRCAKNRFGTTNEVGLFSMTDAGLVGVEDADAAFLRAGDAAPAPGSVAAVTLEGSRPLGVEVQALTSRVPQHVTPRHHASGVDRTRLAMLLAVLSRLKGLNFFSYGSEVFVNVAGGLSLREPAMDLPVALALASSVRGEAPPAGMACAGEVGLSGELRPVPHVERRVAAAARLGFKSIVVPSSGSVGSSTSTSIEVVRARTLAEAVDYMCSP